jgi:hypothetical protein
VATGRCRAVARRTDLFHLLVPFHSGPVLLLMKPVSSFVTATPRSKEGAAFCFFHNATRSIDAGGRRETTLVSVR